jgi:hypothetical protein
VVFLRGRAGGEDPAAAAAAGTGRFDAAAIRGIRAANIYLLAPSACFVSILAFACLYSHINIGVRHVLIAFHCWRWAPAT